MHPHHLLLLPVRSEFFQETPKVSSKGFGSTAHELRAKLMCRTGALDGALCSPVLDTLNGRKGLELVTQSPPAVMWCSTVHGPSCHAAAGSCEEPYETGTTGKPCKIICKPTSNNIARAPKGMRKRSNLKLAVKTIHSPVWIGNGFLTRCQSHWFNLSAHLCLLALTARKKEEQKTESQHPLEVGMKGHWRTEIDLRERQVLWGAVCALLGIRTPSPWPDPITGSRTQRYTEKH